jgi:PadR family transcriptional regulator PadR
MPLERSGGRAAHISVVTKARHGTLHRAANVLTRTIWIGTMFYMVDLEGSSISQLRRGVLEFCVLALLRDEERYGFELVHALSSEGLVVTEGTVYPLLSRLRGSGVVSTFWRVSPVGPSRRYYRITPAGRGVLDAFIVEWLGFRDAVDTLLETGESS